MSIYFFYGQEDFLIDKKINAIKSKLINPDYASISYKVLDNPDFYTLQEAILTVPMMFGNTVIKIDLYKYLLPKKKTNKENQEGPNNQESEEDNSQYAFSENELKHLEEALTSVPEALTVIFVCKIPRGKTKKPDCKKKLYKILEKYAQTEEFLAYANFDKNFHSMIVKMAKEKDLIMSTDTAKFLCEYIGVEIRLLDAELEKIKLIKYPDKNISIEDIKNLSNIQENIFKIIDFWAGGKKDLALLDIKKLSEKKHILATLGGINKELRKVINLKIMSKSMSISAISQETKIHEYLIKLNLEKLKKVPLSTLKSLKANLTNAEEKIKMGEIQDIELALELAFLKK